MPLATSSDRYTIISADSHAGGSHEQYREYLDPAYREEFDAWRAAYKNPFKTCSMTSARATGTANGESPSRTRMEWWPKSSSPNTVPPFFPTGAVVVRPPSAQDYQRRLAGLRAHNRWLAEWCALAPQRRAGIAQILLNDVDEAVADVHRAADAGLRGGVLIPSIPPDFTALKPIYDPSYDPIWRACEERGMPVNSHGGSGNPDYGRYPFATFLFVAETGFFSQRPLVHLLISGAFERFPRLKFVVTEQGCDWLPALLTRLDQFHAQASSGRVGELAYDPGSLTRAKPSELFGRNVWVGVSFPKPADAQVCTRSVSIDSSGEATIRITRAPTRIRANIFGRSSRRRHPTTSAASSPATRPRFTALIWTHSPRSPPK